MAYQIQTTKSWHSTLTELDDCFDKWRGVGEWDANRHYFGRRASGLTREERRVDVWWMRGEKRIEVSLDTQSRPEDNLRAIYLCVESMRMMENRGVADVAASAYMQIAAPATAKDPWEVLGVRPDAPLEVIDASYKALAKKAHPDTGGSDEAMKELNEAFEAVTT